MIEAVRLRLVRNLLTNLLEDLNITGELHQIKGQSGVTRTVTTLTILL